MRHLQILTLAVIFYCRNKRFRSHCAQPILILTLALAAGVLHAQSALVRGHITDSSGASVSSAAVEIQNTGTGLRWTSTTNGSGYYQFPPLDPGSYTLRVSAASFAPATVSGLKLEVGGTPAVDVALQPASAAETVLVSASAPELEFDHPDRGNVIESEFVQTMPLNIRNPLQMVNFAQGVTPYNLTPATTIRARPTPTLSASMVPRFR